MTASSASPARIGILHEHPDWFRPLFAELDRRGIGWDGLDPRHLLLDPERPLPGYDLVLNRMSPSGFLRGASGAVFATRELLSAWEARGTPVLNGTRAWDVELSKIRQLRLLHDLDLPAPRSRFVAPEGIRDAAAAVGFPLVVKPDIGGSGAGIRRFASLDELDSALVWDPPQLGPTGVGLVQEYVRPRGGHIQRIEVLDGEVLYGIRVHAPDGEFNLCPADVCRTVDGAELARGACAVDAADQGLAVEAFEPPPEVAREVVRIAEAAGITLGGVEYTVDDASGRRLYYDVNALSNFVADGRTVLGFDPFARFVDWIEARLQRTGGGAEDGGGMVGKGVRSGGGVGADALSPAP